MTERVDGWWWLLDEADVASATTGVSAVAECTMDGRRPATGRVVMSDTVELRRVAGGEGISDCE